MRVAVIGGGPSGLVTLKYLKTAHEFVPMEHPISVKLFEKEAEIGGAFKHQAYEGAEVCYVQSDAFHLPFSSLLCLCGVAAEWTSR